MDQVNPEHLELKISDRKNFSKKWFGCDFTNSISDFVKNIRSMPRIYINKKFSSMTYFLTNKLFVTNTAINISFTDHSKLDGWDRYWSQVWGVDDEFDRFGHQYFWSFNTCLGDQLYIVNITTSPTSLWPDSRMKMILPVYKLKRVFWVWVWQIAKSFIVSESDSKFLNKSKKYEVLIGRKFFHFRASHWLFFLFSCFWILFSIWWFCHFLKYCIDQN